MIGNMKFISLLGIKGAWNELGLYIVTIGISFERRNALVQITSIN